MANTFDQFDDTPSSSNPFDQFDKEPAKPSGALRDLGKSLKVGVQKLPGMVTGLADLPIALATGARPFTSAADAVGEATGFQPGKWADETQRSDDYKAGQANVNKAWAGADAVEKEKGALSMDYASKLLSDAPEIAGAYLKNPMYTANQVVESVPGMITGGVASKAIRGLGALAGKGISAEAAAAGAMGPVRNAVPGYVERAVGDKLVNPVVAGIGEGAVTAGSAMDNSKGEDQQKNAIAALGAGVGTGLIGVGAGRLANKIGLETSGTAMAKLGDGTLGNGLGATKRILGGAISEGAFQELPQSMQEAMWQNYVNGKPIMQGVARQGIEGALAGAVMGGGANVFNSDRQATPPPEQPPAVPPVQPGSPPQDPAQLGYDPMAGTHTVFPDGSVILNSESSNGAQTVRDMQRANRLANIPRSPSETLTSFLDHSISRGDKRTQQQLEAAWETRYQDDADPAAKAFQAEIDGGSVKYYDGNDGITDVTPNPIRDPIAEAAAQGGAISRAVLAARESGAIKAHQDQQANEASIAEAATLQQEIDRQGVEADAPKPIAGDVETNSMGYPLTNKIMAGHTAKKLSDSTGQIHEPIELSPKKWVARKKVSAEQSKDANVSDKRGIQPIPATSSGSVGNQPPASVGLGATDGNGVGTDTGGRSPGALDQPRQLPGGALRTPVAQGKPQPTALGTQTNANAGPGFTEKDVLRVKNTPATEQSKQNTVNSESTVEQTGETPTVVAGNAATTDNVPGAGSVAVEGGGVAKEPWQMTYKQYLDTFDADGREWEGLRASEHRVSVSKAVKEGRMSPDSASMMGYPDIANDARKANTPGRLEKIVSAARGVSDAAIDGTQNNDIKATATELKKLFGSAALKDKDIAKLMDRFGPLLSQYGLSMQIGPDFNPTGNVAYFASIRGKVAAVIENAYREVLAEAPAPQDASAANRAKLKAKNTPDSQTKEKPSVTTPTQTIQTAQEGSEAPAAAGVTASPEAPKNLKEGIAKVRAAKQENPVAPSSPNTAAINVGFSSLEKEMQSKATPKEFEGAVGVVMPGSIGIHYATMNDAVTVARKAIAAGTRPVPFQIHNATSILLGDTDRVIAALESDQKPPQPPANTAKPATESVATAREATEHVGVKIYPITFKGEPRWSVQTEDNRANGKVLGDTIHATLDEAKQEAERQVVRVKSQQERSAAHEAEAAAAQAKKDANKGKSIVERKRDADLDKPTRLHPNAGLGTGTRRESMQKAVDQDRYIEAATVRDEAAKKRDTDLVERSHKANLPTGNINYPGVKEYFEAQARLKANKYEKPEYRVYMGRDGSDSFYEITKTEYYYAQELKSAPKDPRENYIKSAADSIGRLRKSDVDRVLNGLAKDNIDGVTRADLAAYIKENHPDFAQEVDEVMAEIATATKAPADLVAGDRFKDANGAEFQVWSARQGRIEAHPVVDGKPVVNRDSVQRWATTDAVHGANPEYRTDIVVQPAAVHQDPGQAPESATAPVIAQSIAKAARKEDRTQKEMRLWLVGEIDKAVKLTEDYADYQESIKKNGQDIADSIFFGKHSSSVGLTTPQGNGTITFDVPGDGKFKIRNSLRGLMEFRAKVEAKSGTGFTDKTTKAKGLPASTGVAKGSSNQIEALSSMLEELDFEAAVDYARETGTSLDAVKISPEVRKQFETYLKDGTEPQQFTPSREWNYQTESRTDKDGYPTRGATLTKKVGADEYKAGVTGTNATGFVWSITKNGKTLGNNGAPPKFQHANLFVDALKLAEDAINAIQPEVVKQKDTGWNMEGVGFAGKRYRGRNITLDDGREVVARIYENAGQYEDAEVKVDGKRVFAKTDRYKAEKLADDFIQTLTAKEPAKAPIKVTPQVSGNAEKFIKVAADSVDKLRQVDVERVLSETPVHFRAEVSAYIKSNRAGLSDEVDAVMADLNEPAQASQTEPKREFRNPDNLNVLHAPIEDKDWFKLKNGEEWQARQGYSGRGWSLVRDGSLHPEARNFESQSDFIRSVIEVTGQTQASGQVAAPVKAKSEKEYRYAMVNRPVDIGTAPKDGLIRTEERPVKGAEHHDMARNGVAVYNRELTDAETKQFEMAPMSDADQLGKAANLVAQDMTDYAEQYVEMHKENRDEFVRKVSERLKGTATGYAPSVGSMDKFADLVASKLANSAKPITTAIEANDEPIPAVTEAQARKQFEWRNMGQKDGTKSHLLFFFESEKDKGTGAAMNRGEVSLYPGASGWKVEDGDGTSYKSLADAKKAAIDLAIPKLQDQGYILKPAAEATAILDAANVTGKERIEALKDVKKGDITPEELQAAYPAKEDKFPSTAQGAIDAFNADDSAQAVAIMAKLKLDDLKEVGGAIGFRPQNGENAKSFRERIGTVADKLTLTNRKQTSNEMKLHTRLTQLASDYDRAIAHRDRAIANGAEAGSSAFEGQYEGQWTTIDKGLEILENALREESKSPDYAKVSAMVKEARPAIFDAAKPDNSVKPEAGGMQFSRTTTGTPTLIIQHNLTEENLLHADRMGGIPVPSLAITQAEHPLVNFGEITLLGGVDMANPKGYAATKVFGADIYSPRYPRVTYGFTDKMKRRGEAMLKDGIDATGTNIAWGEVANNGADELRRTPAIRWQVLTDNGLKPEIIRTEAKPLPKAMEPFANDNRPPHELAQDPAFIEAAYKAHEVDLVRMYDGDAKAAQEELAQLKERANERGVSYLVRGYANDVQQHQRDTRSAGAIDRQATNRAMEVQIEEAGLRDKLEVYSKEYLRQVNPDEKLFQGFTNMGNRKYIPHTLDNVIKILKKDMVGGEGFNYGVGSVRSRFTPQFKSIAEIQKAKGRLMDEKAFDLVKEEVNNELSELSNALRSYHDASERFGFGDTVTSTLSDSAKMGLSRALTENGFKDVPQEVKEQIAEFLGKLRNMPTAYFEAKILRAVDVSEFKGAVVPTGTSQKAIDALARRGITNIKYYDKSIDGDRAAKIQELAKESDLLFSRANTQNPTTVQALQSAIRDLVGAFGGNKLGRIVATTASEIKSTWEPLIGSSTNLESEGNAGKAQAFYDPKTNTVFLIADHIEAGNETAVLAHELMHKWGKQILGEAGWNKLHSVISSWADAKEGSQERQVYDQASAAVDRVGVELSSEELFPYAVEAAIKMGIKPNMMTKPGTVTRWLAEVRNALKQVWEKIIGKPDTFKAQDLVNLAFGIAQMENPELAAVGGFKSTGQTDTPAFRKWFGDSKVVDADGKPLVVYHGTTYSDIDSFKPQGPDGDKVLNLWREAKANNGRFGYMNFRGGSFFSPHPEYAGNYTHENTGVMYPVYIKAENPIYFDQVTGKVSGVDPNKTPDALFMMDGDIINEIAVIDPTQIKSAIGNNGNFDPSNPDIRYARGTNEPMTNNDVVGNQGGRSADDTAPGGTHPFNGFTREQFLGNPKITSDANAKDLVPSSWKSLESEKNVPFAIGSGLTARYSEFSAAVYNEKGDVVASYSFGDTLVVNKKYRRQGIGSELVYQWRMRNPNSKTAATRTKKSQLLQEKVWNRIRSERDDVSLAALTNQDVARKVLGMDDAPAMSRTAFSRPAFSRGAMTQANESVTRLANGIASHWENAPKVVVAFDMNDPIIPENVRKEDMRQRSGGATGTPEGFFYKGTVYLMSSKLGTPDDIARVMFHESLGHYGLRGLFGKALKPILREISMRRRAEVDAKIKQYGLKMGNKLDRFTAAEEVLAELAQTRPEIGIVQRAIAAIRTWLRKNVPGFKNMRLTDAEIIRSYILPARAYVENSGHRKYAIAMPLKNGEKATSVSPGFYVNGVRQKYDHEIDFNRSTTGVDDRIEPTFSRSIGDTLTSAANSARDGLTKATVTDLNRQFGNRLSDFRGLGLQTLGRRQLVDLYAGDLPQMEGYSRMVAQMDADKNESGAEADALATGWGKLKDERQLAELMHDATLAQIDPDKSYVTGDDQNFYDALRDGFDRLTPEAKAAYRKARDMYSGHNDKVREAIRERIMRSEMSSAKKQALLTKMEGEFFKKVKGVYFPLARFGQYVTIVKDSNGDVVSANRSETMNEAEATRKILIAKFPASGGWKVGKVLKDKEFNAARDGVGRGFMADLFETLDKTNAGDELTDAISQLYLAALPDLSWAKHGIHRKGTPGFSQDARRAFAQNMFHGARYLAKLRYADQLQVSLDDMQTHIANKADVDSFDSVKAQQVVDEMVKRHDSMMNPQTNPISTALTSFGFVFHLGLSPASALVNLSQTALVAYPVMGSKWGFGKASAALLDASRQAAGNKNDISKVLKGDELVAYNEAVRSGVIDVTMAHDLAGIAQGEDSKVSAKIRPVMKAASFLFHHAEKFNRQVTFVAAYRLSRDAGTGHQVAYEQAVKATYDGHFDYSASNRPRVMQGNVAKVVLLFKQYAQNMIYTLTRQAQLSLNAATPKERAEARKALSGLLVSHALAAGAFGLPMVGMLLGAASAIGGDDDEPWDAKVALQNMLADTLGQKPAEVLAHGLSRLTPWDISGRVGLDKLLLPDVQEGLQGSDAVKNWMASALGPVAGIAVNAGKGMQDIANGQYIRGMESMLPSALRSPLKAYRYGTEGNIDKTGVAINDEVSAAGVAGQALGFSPSETRLAQEGKSAIYSADRAIQERRSSLTRQFALAAMAKDQEGMADARKDIERFNEKNPKARITPVNLMQSVHARRKRIEQSEQGVYLPKKRQDAIDAGRFAVVD